MTPPLIFTPTRHKEEKMKKIVLGFLLLFLVVSVVGCQSSGEKPEGSSTLKVGFIYIGDPADGGFTKMHDEGRKYLVEKLGVETTEIMNIDDMDAQTFNTRVRELIDQGNKLIIATSYGYGQPEYELAQDFPDITFLHFSGDFLNSNMGNYFGKMYEARYIAGAVTGLNIPEGGVVGYVAAFPIPEVIRAINAFTLGLQSTNPTATVKVAWTNTWFDPTVEKQAGEGLVQQGVKAMTIHQDTPSALQPMVDAGGWAVGYHTDMSESLGNDCLISAVWNLGPYYVKQVQAVIDGTWKSEAIWGGFEDGENNMVTVSKVSPKAVDGSQQLADELVAKITNGELKVFSGPIYDNTGKLQIAEGTVYPASEIWNMEWFVAGVSVVN